ncbi:hypothetical protein KAX35_08250 [candidate division WOR-3 bacterium]|nr:hypothetical protein [candidate division WOR-3 bacterium]
MKNQEMKNIMTFIILICFLIGVLVGCGKKSPTDSDNVSYWQKVESPTTQHMNSVYFVSQNDGWIVGAGGIILHYDGINWQMIESPIMEPIIKVQFLYADDGWAAAKGEDSCIILHYDGDEWSIHSKFKIGGYLTDMFFLSSTNGWVTTWAFDKSSFKQEAAMYHWDGSSWYDVSPFYANLYSVFFVDENNGWVSGHICGIEPYDNFAHYDGTEWEVIQSPIGLMYSSLYFLSADDGWCVGYGIAHYDGDEWSAVVDSGHFSSVHFISPNDGWAVGYKLILHYDGSEWIVDESPEKMLYSVYFVSENEGWAVGSEGVILHYLKD